MPAHRSTHQVQYETISVLQLQETAKAYLVVDDSDVEYWLPKSQIEVVDCNSCDEMIIKLPTWIRESKDREMIKHQRAKFAAENVEAYKKQREKIASWHKACRGNGL